eukprot:354306-Chlamydomonas_euryale.AAC.4
MVPSSRSGTLGAMPPPAVAGRAGLAMAASADAAGAAAAGAVAVEALGAVRAGPKASRSAAGPQSTASASAAAAAAVPGQTTLSASRGVRGALRRGWCWRGVWGRMEATRCGTSGGRDSRD